jgi:Zn-finger nucleic acid-binding protein
MNPYGIFWECPNCAGHALTLSILRQSVPEPIVKEFWRRIKYREYPSKRLCPACKAVMSEVPILPADQSLYLDVCKTCNLIWFDPYELEALPKVEISEENLEELPQELKEVIAKHELGRLCEEQRKADEREGGEREEKIYFLINIAIRLVYYSIRL